MIGLLMRVNALFSSITKHMFRLEKIVSKKDKEYFINHKHLENL